MMILMALVIAMFVIVGVYVGYTYSQQPVEEGESHNINTDLELFEQHTVAQILQNPELRKTTL